MRLYLAGKFSPLCVALVRLVVSYLLMGVYLSGPLLGAHVYLPNGIDFVSEGPRTMIPGGILPHQKVIVPVTVQFPWHRKDYLIKISLVQEGCAWFYWENPANALEINEQR